MGRNIPKTKFTLPNCPHHHHHLTSLLIFHQTTPILIPYCLLPLSLLLGTSCSTDPLTLENHEAWSSGCFSPKTHSLEISSTWLALNSISLQHRLLTPQTPRSNHRPDTSILMNDRHLKVNMPTHIPNCYPIQINPFPSFT